MKMSLNYQHGVKMVLHQPEKLKYNHSYINILNDMNQLNL